MSASTATFSAYLQFRGNFFLQQKKKSEEGSIEGTFIKEIIVGSQSVVVLDRDGNLIDGTVHIEG